jgi:disulfide oxidoreductase YuzD
MNYHLIIGYGYWSKKNLAFLSREKIFDSIIIKSRKNYFFFSDGSVIRKNQFNEIKKKINTIHICTPIKTHFNYLKKFSSFKKTVVEKPFLEKISQLNSIERIYKNRYFVVNYIDTFNPLINKIKKSIQKKDYNGIVLNYSKREKFYNSKKEFALEWLDHPLSLILLFFKKFPKFNIEVNQLRKRNKKFNRRVIINYNFKNFELKIKLNCSKNIERNLQINKRKYIETFHFVKNSIDRNNKKVFQSKIGSFDNFYNLLKKGKKSSIQNFKFHKKIILERSKISKKINKI